MLKPLITHLRKLFIVDISSDDSLVARRLSNFTARSFGLDGVTCGSMKGFLQSLKYPDPQEQTEICALSGKIAWRKGRTKRARRWQENQMLTWQGVTYPRRSQAYQDLLTRAFDALATDPSFQEDLLATGNKRLKHSIGKSSSFHTVLTEQEFIDQLTRLRKQMHRKEPKEFNHYLP